MNSLLMTFLKKHLAMADEELEAIAAQLDLKVFDQGTVLVNQGDIPEKCYFILEGCVRQYAIDMEGEEHTYQFYTEYETVNVFPISKEDPSSAHSLVCMEQTTAIVGDTEVDTKMYDTYPELQTLTMAMMQRDMTRLNMDFSDFRKSSPTARYQMLLEKRPSLIDRVPQHQLASYLGIKPETLSRIKKRLKSL